jgi:hypothetical protein
VPMPPIRRHRRTKKAAAADAGTVFVRLMKRQLVKPDPRSHAEFLHDMRSKQAAGQLANPASAALLDRLERSLDGIRNRV